MRLKTQLVTGILMFSGMLAVSLPVQAQDESGQKPGMLSRMFHRSPKKYESTKSEAATKAEGKKHTNGFPEPDKKGIAYQPQTVDSKWVDEVWKTTRNKDTFKQTDAQ